MMAWLPTYFVDTLSVDLMHASQTALLPPLAAIAASAVAGNLADTLISKGVAVGTVRKLAQGLAFLGPCTCLLVSELFLCGGWDTPPTTQSHSVNFATQQSNL